MPRPYKNDRLVEQLLRLFPDGDPGYFRACLSYYETAPVERIAEKIFHNGGHYPRLLGQGQTRTQQLNEALRLLATEFFPDCDIAYLRERLLLYDHSYVEQVANELLQEGHYPERLDYGKLDRSDFIKSESYCARAQTQLAIDYPQVWKSSIRAVLAENNWDYVKSYDQLHDMGSGGFWTTLRNFIRHWPSFPSSSTMVHDTAFDHDLSLVRQRALDAQAAVDAKLALQITEDEYDQLITCQCCYGDYVIEQLLFCSEGAHMFCHTCIQHYISEGLFGQGALRGKARVACISMDACDGCFSHNKLKSVLTEDIWQAYQTSIFEENMRSCQSKIVRCSACGYCEIDEFTAPLHTTLQRLAYLVTMARWIMVFFIVTMLYNSAFLWLVVCPLLLIASQWDLKGDIERAYDRIACHRRGSVFQCRNPECARLTCVLCQHRVRGLHKCWEKEQDGLRLYVEKAMADAVKRTCPVCGLSFQKADGCNKIVCHCGYTMCYVCRKDIRKESYAHFCDHFREVPGTPCDQCNKCDLYKTDPEDEAVSQAASKARREYLRAHPEVAATQPNHVMIGPISTLEQINEWRHETVLWVLQQALDFIV